MWSRGAFGATAAVPPRLPRTLRVALPEGVPCAHSLKGLGPDAHTPQRLDRAGNGVGLAVVPSTRDKYHKDGGPSSETGSVPWSRSSDAT